MNETRNHGGRGVERRTLKRWLSLLFVLPCALWLTLFSGCVRAHAAAIPSPPLEVPAPPPRDIEVRDVEPPPAPVPPAPVPTAPEPARPAPARPRPAEAPKPEPAPAAPKPVDESVKPPTTLQTTPTAADAELERTIRATLARATADLQRIDARRLGAEAREQYDTASRFARQAEEAIRAKNLVFARTLADKAAALAAQLAGR